MHQLRSTQSACLLLRVDDIVSGVSRKKETGGQQAPAEGEAPDNEVCLSLGSDRRICFLVVARFTRDGLSCVLIPYAFFLVNYQDLVPER